MEHILATLLVVHGVMGAVDTLYNHEFLEHLPRRIEARGEIALHAARETIFAMLFGGLAWFAWQGAWALVPGALLAIQVLVDGTDEFVENRIRVLPQNERVLHFLMTLNLGLIAAALTIVLFDRASRPTGIFPTRHGIQSWLLSALSLGAIAWAVRDGLAWRALSREQ